MDWRSGSPVWSGNCPICQRPFLSGWDEDGILRMDLSCQHFDHIRAFRSVDDTAIFKDAGDV